MADFILSKTLYSWAKFLHSFIIWKLVAHLFLLSIAKSSLHHNCSPKLVSFRFAPFSKCWYASYRSLCHDCNELWTKENGWVFRKLCWIETWCSFMFLHDSSMVVRFNEFGCWIIDAWCLLVLMVYLISKTVTKRISRFVEQDEGTVAWTHKP